MAGFPLYSNNSMPSWYDASEDVVMNDGNDFSFLAAQPIKAQQSQAPGGYPMEFYDLVLEKSPKAHYLVLKTHSGDPPKPDIFYMPHIVYLENDGQVLSDKKHHPCLYPGRGCWKDHNRRSFARAADLERHYNVVHHASVEEIKCDYPRCARHTDAFTRKDHCRDHYKEFHKEDIGSYKGAKNNIDKAQWQAKQQQWADERQIKPEWWRCPRCLDRIYVATEDMKLVSNC
ncbi:hypothetical protein M7I_5718 [Glarea lozoyensis 74030]|uniref:C2H2-type domain-containing protein n=1 Tax=Glarea lozoyensis (strain ATCC 74030 / MF5533) TaxID=1104152 RepID=H0ESM0_GLAL7|nr:hypothetical protein M7I_5718 [Glarea lozoyensis 74030]